MKVWIDNIELEKVDISSKDTEGPEFLPGEMVVYYTAYKAGNHTWQGEFKCARYNPIDIPALIERIAKDLKTEYENE